MIKADAAGNAADAKVFADEIRKMRTAEQPQAPGSQPLPPVKDMIAEGAGNVFKGMLTGGPVGAMTAMGGEALKNSGRLMDRAAYNVGGGVTDALAPYLPAEVAAGAGYAANVGTQAIPTVIGGLVGSGARKPLQAAGENVMRRALKPGLRETLSGEADDAVRTLLDEGVNVTEGGVGKLNTLASGLTKQADDLISGATGNIDKGRVAKAIVRELKKSRLQPNPTKDIAGVSRAWDEFAATNTGDIPVQLANELKRGGQKAVDESYGKLSRGREAGVKAINRGLREAVEDIVPEVGPLNARNRKILNALEQVEKRVGVSDRRDLFGITPIADPKAMAAMLADRSQLIKSLLARMLYSGGGTAGTTAGAMAGAGMGYSQGQPP